MNSLAKSNSQGKKNPCVEKDEMKEKINDETKKFRIKVKECEEELHGDFIKTYFSPDTIGPGGIHLTHRLLLQGLFNYYNEEKKNDINFTLTFQQFIDKFPRDTPVLTTNFNRAFSK